MPTERANRIVNLEPQWCPRRSEGPAGSFPGPDYWQRGRWATTDAEADAEVADMLAHANVAGVGHLVWSYGGEQPRTCSFCGGVNPDDAVALIRAGWEVEATSKGYKRYLQPPGYHAHVNACLAAARSGEPFPAPQHPSPTPPVKLYVQHFSPEQITAFNAALARPGDAAGEVAP